MYNGELEFEDAYRIFDQLITSYLNMNSDVMELKHVKTVSAYVFSS
jgi:hypothetical protein